MLRGLDLFTGIGGITLALEPWVRPVAYCEKDRYAQSLLLSRMHSGDLPRAPIWDDVQTLCGKILPPLDIIYGGFPCTDISVAGRGVGLEGKQSGLFFEIVRLAKEIQPTFLFLENVPAIRTRGLSRVIEELTACGYDCRWNMLSAAQMGAPHKRERWFLLAHTSRPRIGKLQQGRREGSSGESSTDTFLDGSEESLANSAGVQRKEIERDESQRILREVRDPLCERGREGWTESEIRRRKTNSFSPSDAFRAERWQSSAGVRRVAHGVPHRVDRLRGLGNAVVPLQARTAFEKLIGIEAVKAGQ